MFYFIKKRDKDNDFDQTDVYVRTDHISVDELMGEFCRFLLGCGFQKGSIQQYIDFEMDDDSNDK